MAGQFINKEEANELVRKYPWFSYAYLSAFSHIDENVAGYGHAASAASLHFPDPVHLDLLLHKFRHKASPLKEDHEPGVTSKNDFQEVDDDIHVDTASGDEPAVETVSRENENELNTGIEKDKVANEIPKIVLADPKETGIAFEPLHTTDYFASQGIKLSEEQQSGDKLGKQMKSFTAWLKTMKKVHQSSEMPPEDVSVKIIAEKSNLDEEVVTESMAEVYAGQGKTEKAREIYRKLSLINPAKSAYFAQKIDLLNN